MKRKNILGVLLIFGLIFGHLLTLKGQTSNLKIQAAKEDRQLTMPWRNCISIGRAHNLLRADILKQLA